MRIGEVARAAGVSTRTVRHYHQVGVLPEPSRTVSGYRVYGIRDLVRLSHARRLVELGLGLAEVRDVLAGDEARDLSEIIDQMDAELAVQAERIAERRRRLAELRSRVNERGLGVDDLPEPALVEFFTRVEASGAGGPMLQLDRQMLSFLPAEEARRWTAPLLHRMADEEFTDRLVRMYDDFDRLEAVAPEDPAVARFVETVWDLLPPESREALLDVDVERVTGPGVMDAVYAEMAPAQAEAARLLIALMADHTSSGEGNG